MYIRFCLEQKSSGYKIIVQLYNLPVSDICVLTQNGQGTKQFVQFIIVPVSGVFFLRKECQDAKKIVQFISVPISNVLVFDFFSSPVAKLRDMLSSKIDQGKTLLQEKERAENDLLSAQVRARIQVFRV